MPVLKKLTHLLRVRALRLINERRMSRVRGLIPGGKTPVFVPALPLDMHLAPLAVMNGDSTIQHIIVGNGLSTGDARWLQNQIPGIPVINLQASLFGNSKTLLSHAEVISLCHFAARADFGIQDADCFVMDSAWWKGLRLTSSRHYAAGPFAKPMSQLGGLIPDTYLVLLSGARFSEYTGRGVPPDIAKLPPPALRELLTARGITGDYFPEGGKQYFDTLQAQWVMAALEGGEILRLPGADETVIHIGGSNYLTQSFTSDVTHWDYWALNTCYFHLRILESSRLQFLRPRFSKLFQHYGSAKQLLALHPDFTTSKRFANSQRILDSLAGVYQG